MIPGPGPATARVPSTPLRAAPDPAAEQVDQLLFGEGFEVVEAEGAWVRGRAMRDGYEAWAHGRSLRAGVPAPTHRISAVRAFAFARPDFKAAAGAALPLNALVRVLEARDGYARVAGVGWVAKIHLAPIGTFEVDPAAVAMRHLGVPYLWGGRDGLGLDCSGLVQQALFACGRGCPRDSDRQESLGAPLRRAELRRNDLVFWAGHVAMMTDEQSLVHANVHHMAVAAEPLQQVIERRLGMGDGPPTAYRRVVRPPLA